MPKVISRAELHSNMVNGRAPILLEALPEKYFVDGHLPGAKHMPHDAVKACAPSLIPDKDTAIVVYCASEACRNSHKAADALEALGYTDVAVYAGGKQDWQAAGYMLETD